MTITATQNSPHQAHNRATGRYLDDAASPAAAALTLGFTPRKVKWHNLTDRISYEWFEGMANGTTLKTVAAGTRTLDTADVAISVSGGTVTIGASAILQSKQYQWEAEE